jgi:putative membrane protein
MHTTKFSLLTLSLGLMFAAGCSKSNSDTTPPEPAMTEPTEPAPVVMAEPTPEPEPVAEVEPPAPPPLTDGEIVAIAKAAHDGEIEHAKLAKTRAKHKKVKAFAAMLAKEHAEANKREGALIKRVEITLLDNEASRKLAEDAKVRTETLTSAGKGAEFDRAYMETQVQMHTTLLDMLTNRMLPAAQNPELKAEVEAMRAAVEAHLTEAKEIQAELTPPSA